MIAQSLATSADNDAAGALCVVNPELGTIGVPKIELGEVVMQVSL